MMLTKEQADEALKAINSFGTKPCPYCGSYSVKQYHGSRHSRSCQIL